MDGDEPAASLPSRDDILTKEVRMGMTQAPSATSLLARGATIVASPLAARWERRTGRGEPQNVKLRVSFLQRSGTRTLTVARYLMCRISRLFGKFLLSANFLAL